MSAKVLVLSGYGLNCEEETLYAFEYAGLQGEIRHINDLIDTPQYLDNIEILAIPGGFSYGDDTGSGNAFAQKMRLALQEKMMSYISRDTLTIGICNGCQIIANLGLIPGFGGKYGERQIAVTYNKNARYQCRWVDVGINEKSRSPWLRNIDKMHIPVAHGEGRFMMNEETLSKITENNQIAVQYIKPDGRPANGDFPYNPNGSVADIAGITDQSGKILAIMPHPERGMFSWQRDDYHEQKDIAQRNGDKLAEKADGIKLFENAAAYFKTYNRKTA